jgi:accessory secretory protein Asp2
MRLLRPEEFGTALDVLVSNEGDTSQASIQAYMLWQKQFVTMISFEMFAKIFDLMPVSTLEKYHSIYAT